MQKIRKLIETNTFVGRVSTRILYPTITKTRTFRKKHADHVVLKRKPYAAGATRCVSL